MNKHFRWLATVWALAFTVVITPASQEKPKAAETPAATKSRALVIEPFMRVTNTSPNVVELQIALRKFSAPGGQGPAVWLTAVSHIGETNYYTAIQKHLDAQALVLFEGVQARAGTNDAATAAKAAPAGEPPKSEPAKSELPKKVAKGKPAPVPDKSAKTTSIQHTLAESLGLVFQLEAIDYKRAHFRNSDLSIQELQKIMEGDPKDGSDGEPAKKNEQLERLVKVMDGSSFIGKMLAGVIQLIGTSPKLQGLTRLALIETLGQIRGDITQMKGLPPEMQTLMKVLIVERNRAVMKDLKAELEKAAPAKSISIFYGAGHMEDFERRLRRELKLEPDETQWLPAFSVDLSKAGLSKFEAEMIRGMVKRQMEAILP